MLRDPTERLYLVEEDEEEINDRTDDKVNKNKEYCGKMYCEKAEEEQRRHDVRGNGTQMVRSLF